jgi:hypothetical protein
MVHGIAAFAVIFRRCKSKDTPCSLLLLLSSMVALSRSLGHLCSYKKQLILFCMESQHSKITFGSRGAIRCRPARGFSVLWARCSKFKQAVRKEGACHYRTPTGDVLQREQLVASRTSFSNKLYYYYINSNIKPTSNEPSVAPRAPSIIVTLRPGPAHLSNARRARGFRRALARCSATGRLIGRPCSASRGRTDALPKSS